MRRGVIMDHPVSRPAPDNGAQCMGNNSYPSVAIIGGGLSGAAVAYHLARRHASATLTVLEPRATIGAGLAYSTPDPAHRINVPAAKMSLIPAEDRHFVDWISRTHAIADDPEAVSSNGEVYARRIVFGRYVFDHLKPWIASGRIAHVRDSVRAIARAGSRWSLQTASGRTLLADIVVIATTHPAPEVPPILADGLKDDPRLIISDAMTVSPLSGIEPEARVTIIGTGLTMADTVASLDRRGHRGTITAISRRGLLSRPHATAPYQPFGQFDQSAPYSALDLLRKIRTTIREVDALDLPWQAVIDQVRAQASAFWPKLPETERRKIVQHLRPYWDVHRFRIAPQVQRVIARRRSEGTFTSRAASVAAAEANADHILLQLRTRGKRALEEHRTDYVIVTTGPAHSRAVEVEPHLNSLASAGWIRADGLGLGIFCDRQGRAISREGQAVSSLLIAGPLARATFGELMGLPQVTSYAQEIANQVIQELDGMRIVGQPLPEQFAKAR